MVWLNHTQYLYDFPSTKSLNSPSARRPLTEVRGYAIYPTSNTGRKCTRKGNDVFLNTSSPVHKLIRWKSIHDKSHIHRKLYLAVVREYTGVRSAP